MSDAARAFIESRLQDISRAPKMWGSPEAIEFQVLLLLELEDALAGGTDPRVVLDGWYEVLRARFPGQPPAYGHQITDDADALVALLLEYRQSRAIAPVFPLFDTAQGRRRASAR